MAIFIGVMDMFSDLPNPENPSLAFETIHRYFTKNKDTDPVAFAEVEESAQKIVGLLDRYRDQEIGPMIESFAARMITYKQITREEPELQDQVLKLAGIVSDTLFNEQMMNQLILSITPSPTQFTSAEKTMIVAWTRFNAHFFPQAPPKIGTTMQGLGRLLSLHGENAILHEPYLNTLAKIIQEYSPENIVREIKLKDPHHLDFIQTLFANFVKFYLLSPLYSRHLPPGKIEEITLNFNHYFSLISPSLFVKTSRPINASEKAYIIEMMRAISRFLEKLLYTLEHQKNIEAPAFVESLYKSLYGTATSYDRQAILAEIHDKIKRLLSTLFQKGPFLSASDQLLILLLSTTLTKLVDHITEPAVIPFAIEQLLQRGIPEFESSSQMQKIDPEFAATLGREVSNLSKLFFSLASQNAKLTLVITGVKLLINTNESKIGEKIHKLLNTLMARELMLEPFRFAETILFRDENGMKQPVFLNHLKLSEEEKSSYCKNTKVRFLDKLYPTLMQLIQKVSKNGAKILEGDSTRNYCNTLGEKVWEITQNKDVLLLFISNILSSS